MCGCFMCTFLGRLLAAAGLIAAFAAAGDKFLHREVTTTWWVSWFLIGMFVHFAGRMLLEFAVEQCGKDRYPEYDRPRAPSNMGVDPGPGWGGDSGRRISGSDKYDDPRNWPHHDEYYEPAQKEEDHGTYVEPLYVPPTIVRGDTWPSSPTYVPPSEPGIEVPWTEPSRRENGDDW